MRPYFPLAERQNVFANLLVITGLVFLGIFGFGFLGLAVAYFTIPATEFQAVIGNPMQYGSQGRMVQLMLQGMAATGGFILSSLLYIRLRNPHPGLSLVATVSPRPLADNLIILWTLLLIPALLPLLELTVEWNKSLNLPDGALETYMKSMEEKAGELTLFMTGFESLGEFLLGMVVLAILPAIGEELVFRGILQPLFFSATGSWHRAIWITAFVFSFIHFQFYGFLPRMLLGALFGYLYYWSGNISIPILGHFMNNGLTVTLIYLSKRGNLNIDPEALPAAPLPVLIGSAVAGAAVLYRFYQRYALKG